MLSLPKLVVLSPLVRVPTAATWHTWHSATLCGLPAALPLSLLAKGGFLSTRLSFGTVSGPSGAYAGRLFTGPISGCSCVHIVLVLSANVIYRARCFRSGTSTSIPAVVLSGPMLWYDRSQLARTQVLSPASCCLPANPSLEE